MNSLSQIVSTRNGTAKKSCQKCMSLAHWTYECKQGQTYISKPSRTQQLKMQTKKKLRAESNLQEEKPRNIFDQDAVEDKTGFADKLLLELSDLRRKKQKQESSEED
jgi:hypothetical protein